MCWNTPCTCGWDYALWHKNARIHLAAAALGMSEAALITAIGTQVPDEHPKKAAREAQDK